MEIINEKIVGLWQTVQMLLEKSKGQTYPVRFVYALEKNLRILQPEVESLQKSITAANSPNKEYLEFDTKRVKICEEMCKKDEEGNPIKETLADGRERYIFDSIEIEKELEDKVLKLREEYPEAIEKANKQREEIMELLKSTTDIDLYTIKLENLPEELLGSEVGTIFDLIEE